MLYRQHARTRHRCKTPYDSTHAWKGLHVYARAAAVAIEACIRMAHSKSNTHTAWHMHDGRTRATRTMTMVDPVARCNHARSGVASHNCIPSRSVSVRSAAGEAEKREIACAWQPVIRTQHTPCQHQTAVTHECKCTCRHAMQHQSAARQHKISLLSPDMRRTYKHSKVTERCDAERCTCAEGAMVLV